LDAWYRRSPLDIEDERRRAAEAGREAWEIAARTGQHILARTQSELEALGRTHLAQKAAAAARSVRTAVTDPHVWHEAAMQANAAARGAAHTLMSGEDNRFAAGADALLGKGGAGGLGQRCHANLDREDAQDTYDRDHRPAARALGETLGVSLLFKGGHGAGTSWSKALPPKAKGNLGEDLSAIKTAMKGDWPAGAQQALPVSGGKTIVDIPTMRGNYVEAKLGRYARPSPRQREAQVEYAPRYRVDRWQDHHVGRITGVGAAAAGWPFEDDDW
jgi:hypothetical protein